MKKNLFIILFITLYQLGCNGAFFYPDKNIYFIPDRTKVSFDNITIKGSDQNPLDAWLFYPQQESNGSLIIHFYGNAQNRSAHILSTIWLVQHGFHVLSFDYRGYGRSPGTPERETLILDGIEVIRFAQTFSKTKKLKKIILGQSLGGAVGFVSARLSKVSLDLIVLDSTFASYQDVAIEVLKNHIITWPFQWLPYLLISDDYSPLDYSEGFISDPYWLVIHSEQDTTVPQAAIMPLLKKLPENKLTFWSLPEPGHIRSFLANSETGMRFVRYACKHLSLKNCKS